MALRNPKPITFRWRTVSDTVDASNGPPGACAALSNWIPSPSTDRQFVPRPASIQQTTFAGFTNPRFISALLVVGNRAYGLISTSMFPGNDQPFVFDLTAGAFLTVTGETAANTPATQPYTGDWTPPILAQVGSRVIVTHPGFPGGAIKFGWFDMSGFTASVIGNVTSGSPTITGNPTIAGVNPGMTITGTGIPAGDTVVSAIPFVLTTPGATHNNTTLDNLGSTAGVAVGQVVAGAGIPIGTTVASVDSSSAVTLSQAATATATVSITFSGAVITMLANATANNAGETLTIAGGTLTSPQWGAGDTNINNLPSVPVSVAQFNARAYYALGLNGIVFSDSGNATQVSNNPAVQALTTQDGLAVTALGPLPLNSLLGGVVQSLIAFEGIVKMQQITGDPTTSNLAMNALPLATGTLAPLSITPMKEGLAFVSPEGLRIINFAAQVSDPIGDHGQGVTVPFIYALYPSRICAASNADTFRISVINSQVVNTPTQEWWWDLTRKIFTGPHTFPASQIDSWGDTFLMAPAPGPVSPGSTIWGEFIWGEADWGVGGSSVASLWRSDAFPSLSNTFMENGSPISCYAQTSLLPDNEVMSENAMVEAVLGMALPAGAQAAIVATRDTGEQIGNVLLDGAGGAETIWGEFFWGQNTWGGRSPVYYERRIAWTAPLVFTQMTVSVQMPASYGVTLGNLYMKYEPLGYLLQRN